MGKGKKLFVVSDVHGHYTLLKDALDKAGFDEENEGHLLICCGDCFDRGNENVEVLKYFERLKYRALIKGNHEDYLMKLFREGKFLPHHFNNGTLTTLRDFFGDYSIDPSDGSIDFSGKTRTVDRICDFIDETLNFYETENYVFVHGWLPLKTKTVEGLKKASESSWEKARWMRWTDMYDGSKPLKEKTLVCGHMPTFFAYEIDNNREKGDTAIYYGNGLIAIDAGTFDTKKVNVLVLEDNLI